MTGFVTLAVGDERYYRLAANLLCSYRLNGNCNAPFAIFADRRNKYTDMFDKVIIMENPTLSYLDKLEMLNMPPYEHNIFIDADCLIYNDVALLLENSQLSGVRCYGKAHELTSADGWFLLDDIGEYKDRIKFIPSMHGGIIFFAADDLTQSIYNLALTIASDYQKYRFKYFEKPADEPILALSTAVNNCPPIDWDTEKNYLAYCFFPTVKNISMNIRKQHLSYIPNQSSRVCREGTVVLHWQNYNTKKPIYYREVDRMSMGEICTEFRFFVRWIVYHVMTFCSRSLGWLKRHLASFVGKGEQTR